MKYRLIKAIYHSVMSLPYTVVNGLAVPKYPRVHKLGVFLIDKLDPEFED